VIIDDGADFAISSSTLTLTSETPVIVNIDKSSSKINSPILNVISYNFQMDIVINCEGTFDFKNCAFFMLTQHEDEYEFSAKMFF